jgi:hypothetical protein
MMIRRMVCVVGVIWMLWTVPARAACSGSGTSWFCTAGSSAADVQSALNSASNNATITLDNGSYTWTAAVNFSNARGATIICATVQGCTINKSSTIFGFPAFSTTLTDLYRISGFILNQIGTAQATIWFCNSGPCSGGTLAQIRIDHNAFNQNAGGGAQAIILGDTNSVLNFYGVIDHNTLTSPNSEMFIYLLGAKNNSPPAPSMGTANNLFVEDNTINITTMDNAGQPCVDGWSSTFRLVWRHNSSLNCLIGVHGVTHNGGTDNLELYNNSIAVDAGAVSQGFGDCYRCFHHQGSGMILAFNNSFTAFSGKSGSALQVLHYRDYNGNVDGNALPYCDGTDPRDTNRSPVGTYRGYPCWRQPGRDTTGAYKPMYVWNNFWSDTLSQVKLDMPDGNYGSPDYQPQHMQFDRDAYNAVSKDAQTSSSSPFNGTTGMGFGILARRPVTCATSSETAFGNGAAGVGYFATDDGAQGTLYTCSATNTWAVYYTPYTYPHPLTTGQSDPPDPPTGLTATVQ